MTTPSGTISLSNVNTEFGLAATTLISMNDANVRTLAGAPTGAISMMNLQNKSWNRTLTGVQSAAGCYSAQGGFAVDFSSGSITLTMGVWPTDPPNCQTCSWQWLQFNGRGANNLANDSTSNIFRSSNNVRPYWTQVWTLNISNIGVGSSQTTRAPNWPMTLVSYTYNVTRTGTNSISIVPYPNSWGTGDAGTSISVSNWWRNVVFLGGGDPDTGVLGSINLSWS